MATGIIRLLLPQVEQPVLQPPQLPHGSWPEPTESLVGLQPSGTSIWPAQYKPRSVGGGVNMPGPSPEYWQASIGSTKSGVTTIRSSVSSVLSRVSRKGTPMTGRSETYGNPLFEVVVISWTRPARANVWPAFISTAVSTLR